jgi:hypothetical protein
MEKYLQYISVGVDAIDTVPCIPKRCICGTICPLVKTHQVLDVRRLFAVLLW